MKVLNYKDCRYFDEVIEKAKIAYRNSKLTNTNHFGVNNKMVEIRSMLKKNKKRNNSLNKTTKKSDIKTFDSKQ